MPMERERRFLVHDISSELGFDAVTNYEGFIVQGYLIVDGDKVLRVRKIRHNNGHAEYCLTIKIGHGTWRLEVEPAISADHFEELWSQTVDRRTLKHRFSIPWGQSDLIVVLDKYEGHLSGHQKIEVEFSSDEEMTNFVPPEWFGQEVTDDERYTDASLALYGLPKTRRSPRKAADISHYQLSDGVGQVITIVGKKVGKKMSEINRPIVIGVAGGSASGKTSAVAAHLKEGLGEGTLILSMDDYYRGKGFMEDEAARGNALNWDQPEALNLDLLRQHLAQLKNGQMIHKPVYSFKTGEVEGAEVITASQFIILEGLFALNEKVVDELDVAIFVDIGTHGRILRRLFRDVERTGQRPADILRYFSEIVEPMHEKYVDSSKIFADLIIMNEYSPLVEAERTGLHDVQLKFLIDSFNQDRLMRSGLMRLGRMSQIDTYYNPRDRDLMVTGEILRIREEPDIAGQDFHCVFTYKGPQLGSVFSNRAKFEFLIDQETKAAFLAIYGDSVKVIEKYRVLYSLDDIVFSVDTVRKREHGCVADVGTFIEIRSTHEIESGKLANFLGKLGLKLENGIKTSYFEM